MGFIFVPRPSDPAIGAATFIPRDGNSAGQPACFHSNECTMCAKTRSRPSCGLKRLRSARDPFAHKMQHKPQVYMSRSFSSLKYALAMPILLWGLSTVAQPDQITSVVVYRDSLSDNGNVFTVTGQPGAPYYCKRPVNRLARATKLW